MHSSVNWVLWVAGAAVLAVLLGGAAGGQENFDVHVAQSKWGRGVFAVRDFTKGEVIEECPVIVANKDTWGEAVDNYTFQYGDGALALALGYCSMYNHQDKPNTHYTFADEKGEEGATMTVHATKDIKKGQEIFVSYGDDWWKSRDMKPKQAT